MEESRFRESVGFGRNPAHTKEKPANSMNTPYPYTQLRNSSRNALPQHLCGWEKRRRQKAKSLSTQLRVRSLAVARKEEWKYGHKLCPCCKQIEGEDAQKEDEYHAFCGQCPRTRKLYEKFVDDIEEILSDCGIRGGLRTITQGMSDQNKAKQIFLILLRQGRQVSRSSWVLGEGKSTF